jgi:hypothetical protein
LFFLSGVFVIDDASLTRPGFGLHGVGGDLVVTDSDIEDLAFPVLERTNTLGDGRAGDFRTFVIARTTLRSVSLPRVEFERTFVSVFRNPNLSQCAASAIVDPTRCPGCQWNVFDNGRDTCADPFVGQGGVAGGGCFLCDRGGCGDGVLQAGEDCDDGNNDDDRAGDVCGPPCIPAP